MLAGLFLWWCLSDTAVVKAVGLPLFHKNLPSFGRTEPSPSVCRDDPVEVCLHLMCFLCTVPLVKAAFRESHPWQRCQGRSASPAPNQAEGRRSGYALPCVHACAFACFLGLHSQLCPCTLALPYSKGNVCTSVLRNSRDNGWRIFCTILQWQCLAVAASTRW